MASLKCLFVQILLLITAFSLVCHKYTWKHMLMAMGGWYLFSYIFLIRLVGVSPQGSFLAHVGLSEVLDAGLCLFHLLWCHALEGFHAVFVHVDGEFVHEILGLDVGSIRLQDVSITT